MENENSLMTTVRLSKKQMLLLLTFLAILLGIVVRVSMFSIAPYLKYDARDIPVLICTFIYGPLYGMLLSTISAISQAVVFRAEVSLTGVLINLASSWICIWVAGNAYKINQSMLFALFCVTAVQTLAMTVANMLFTPMFLGVSLQEVLELIAPAVIPFNLLKCGLNGLFVYLCYKKFSIYSDID